MKLRRVELVQTSYGSDVEWVRAVSVGEIGCCKEVGNVDGAWVLLVIEEEEAIADDRGE